MISCIRDAVVSRRPRSGSAALAFEGVDVGAERGEVDVS
jgi:hypothetical protein